MNIQFNKNELEKIRKKHNLLLILLHGSCVDKKLHRRSDVDIAVVKENRKQKTKLFKLIADLAKAIKTDKVDVSDLTNADPLLLFSAVKKSKLLAGKSEVYNSLLKVAFHKYSDYLPYLEKEADFVKQRIKSYVTTR